MTLIETLASEFISTKAIEVVDTICGSGTVVWLTQNEYGDGSYLIDQNADGDVWLNVETGGGVIFAEPFTGSIKATTIREYKRVMKSCRKEDFVVIG